mmetsp:Transcript_44269/g.138788  ORF Transcript_44269/g.138788 Transcript_44269/m.138788 type:complete len:203 (-) Transcript_44269:124-732(-)
MSRCDSEARRSYSVATSCSRSVSKKARACISPVPTEITSVGVIRSSLIIRSRSCTGTLPPRRKCAMRSPLTPSQSSALNAGFLPVGSACSQGGVASPPSANFFSTARQKAASSTDVAGVFGSAMVDVAQSWTRRPHLPERSSVASASRAWLSRPSLSGLESRASSAATSSVLNRYELKPSFARFSSASLRTSPRRLRRPRAW